MHEKRFSHRKIFGSQFSKTNLNLVQNTTLLFSFPDKSIGSPGHCSGEVLTIEAKSLEREPKNWGFCDMKKETCLNGKDGNREIYSKHLQETKLRLMRQTHCQKLLSNTTLAFHPLSELCATGFYTLQAQDVIRSNKHWTKGKLENKRRKKGKFRVSILYVEDVMSLLFQ